MPTLPLLALVCTFAVGILLFWGVTIDDAFIVFRLAENAKLGHGFVWNPGGQPVEGMTSILWTTMLCPFAGEKGLAYTWAKVLGMLALVGALAVFLRLARSILDPTTFRSAIWILVPICPLLTFHAMNGLETSMAVLGVLGMLFCSFQVMRTNREPNRNIVSAAAAYGASWLMGGMVRPELVLYGLLLGAFVFSGLDRTQRYRFLGAVCLTFLGPGLAYFLARWWYFGLPLPLSFYVKHAPGMYSLYGAKYVALSLAGLTGGLVLLGFLGGRGAFRTTIPVDRVRLLFWPSLLLCVSYVSFVPIMGFVYRFTVPFALPLILVASGTIVGTVRDRRTSPARAIAATTASLAVFQLASSVVPAYHFVTVNSAATQVFHVRFGELLAGISSEGRLAAFNEIGGPSFFSGWHSVEGAGVVTPHVARHHELSQEEIVRDFDPDVIIMTVDEHGLERRGAFPGFRLIRKVPWLVYGGGGPRHYQAVFAREDWADLSKLERGVEDLGLGEIDPPWYCPLYRVAKHLFA